MATREADHLLLQLTLGSHPGWSEMRFVGQCERAKPKIGWERKLVPADDSAEGDVYGTCSWVGIFGFTFGFVCDRKWWRTL